MLVLKMHGCLSNNKGMDGLFFSKYTLNVFEPFEDRLFGSPTSQQMLKVNNEKDLTFGQLTNTVTPVSFGDMCTFYIVSSSTLGMCFNRFLVCTTLSLEEVQQEFNG